MIARLFWTGALLLLALGGFFGAAPVSGGPLNPFGILLLALSGVIWFGWDMIGDAYAYRDELSRSNRYRPRVMIVRLGPVMINRLVGDGGE